MVVRASFFVGLSAALTFVAIACGGDDDSGGGPTTPAGNDASTSDVVTPPNDAGGGNDSSKPVASGDLDPTFGTAGLSIFGSPVTSSESASVVLRQADGKLLVVGSQDQTSGAFVVRLTAAGALDTTFGTGGKMLFKNGRPYSATLQPDGKILIAGYTNIMRLAADGSVDKTFGNEGLANIDDMTPNALKVLADGSVLVAGVRPNTANGFTLLKLTALGAKDTAFDTDGYGEAATTFVNARAHSIAIDSQGRIVVSGEEFDTATIPVARYLTTGALDDAFGTNGQVKVPLPGKGSASAVAIQNDGKIIVAGINGPSSAKCVTARLDPTNGAVDTTWGASVDAGAGGIVFGPGCVSLSGLSIRADGKVLVGYHTGYYQLLSDGAYDSAFGTAGVVNVNSGNPKLAQAAFQGAMLLLPDGTIAGVGSYGGQNGSSPTAWKTTATGAIDTTFATAGQALFPFSAIPDEVKSVEVLANDSIVISGDGWKSTIGARTDAKGVVDVTFGTTNGFTDTPIGEPGGLALGPNGRIFVAGEGKVTALDANGKLDTTFVGGGTANVGSPNVSEWFWGTHVAIDPMGRPIVAGYTGGVSGSSMEVARVTLAGAQDTTFGVANGKPSVTAYTRKDGTIRALAVQPDGKTIVAGYADPDGTFVLRLDTSGALDTSFAGGRVVFTDLYADSVALQADGKIVIAGGNTVARVDGQGALDTTFGQGGKASIAATEINAAAVRVRADGKIFVAGNKNTGAKNGLALVRLSASGAVEASTAPVFALETHAHALAFQANGAVIVGGYAVGTITDRDYALARFAP